MPASKFLTIINGVKTLVTSVVTSAGAGDDGKLPALDTTGKLDLSVMPLGIGSDTVSVLTSEAVSAGDYINVYNNAGTLNARKADGAVQTKPARGFVKTAFGSGVSALVYKEGRNDQLSGRTPGERLYLSDTVPGGVTPTAPTGAGKTLQFLGEALSVTAMDVELDNEIFLNS